MRRQGVPYLGKRYLLNKNSNELHDLDNEHVNCQISEIKKEHIEMFEKETDGIIYQTMLLGGPNGCDCCNK